MAPAFQRTYYEVLEIASDAKLIDIKKAYRRLALLHHPDRNNGSAESTEKFKLIGEAYEVLSDDKQRLDYDHNLRPTGTRTSGTPSAYRPSRHSVDPFAQFNDLFRNDPFFNESFREMDSLFSRKFQEGSQGATAARAKVSRKQGWGEWIMAKCGIDVQMTSYSSTSAGVTSSSYSSTRGASTTYTNKNTKTVFDKNGTRVTIQSMERDGNRIEDKYIGQKLVERRVNGVSEPLERIQS